MHELAGEWAPRFHEDQPERIPGPDIGDYLGLPINEAARLAGDTWDASLLTLPEHQCQPHPSDYSPRGPANLRIWKEIDTASQNLIAYHTHISWQAPERTIRSDDFHRPHPPSVEPEVGQSYNVAGVEMREKERVDVGALHVDLRGAASPRVPRQTGGLGSRLRRESRGRSDRYAGLGRRRRARSP